MLLNNIENDLEKIMEIIYIKNNAKNLNLIILFSLFSFIISSTALFFYILNLYSFSIFYFFPFLFLLISSIILFFSFKEKKHNQLFFYTNKTYSNKTIDKILSLYNRLTPDSRFFLSSKELCNLETKEDFLFFFLVEDLRLNRETFIKDNESYYIEFIKKHFKDTRQKLLFHNLNKRINPDY